MENCWTFDKPVASLSTCHLELVVWDGNLVKFAEILTWKLEIIWPDVN